MLQLSRPLVYKCALFLALGFATHSRPLLGADAVISNGSTVTLAPLKITITPPVGWEVLENSRGKALIFQVPAAKEEIKDYSKPVYARNVTLAVAHEARSIDEKEAEVLSRKLEEEFGSAPGVSNFQIVEHRLIDYRGKGDAVLVYTAFDYNRFPMSQMHILVSGDHNSALLTYTDLAEPFQKNEAAMNQAWNSMLSIQLEGLAPKRYHNLIPAGAALLAVFVAGILILLLRRRKARLFIAAEEDNLYSDDSERLRSSRLPESFVTGVSAPAHTVSQAWALDKKTELAKKARSKRPLTPVSEVSLVW